MNQAQVKAIKEFGRLIVIAAVTSALMVVQAYVGLITDPVWAVPIGLFIGTVVKAWDKYKHEDGTTSTGLIPF